MRFASINHSDKLEYQAAGMSSGAQIVMVRSKAFFLNYAVMASKFSTEQGSKTLIKETYLLTFAYVQLET